jgi:hypothetical protein
VCLDFAVAFFARQKIIQMKVVIERSGPRVVFILSEFVQVNPKNASYKFLQTVSTGDGFTWVTGEFHTKGFETSGGIPNVHYHLHKILQLEHLLQRWRKLILLKYSHSRKVQHRNPRISLFWKCLIICCVSSP